MRRRVYIDIIRVKELLIPGMFMGESQTQVESVSQTRERTRNDAARRRFEAGRSQPARAGRQDSEWPLPRGLGASSLERGGEDSGAVAWPMSSSG